MVKKEKHQIQLEELESDFSQHLDISDNHRILFTAPFGQGKSTFLDNFFKNKESQYLVIKLYPVHYSISPNEDIFELIKFDIATQLMVKAKDNLKKEDFSILLTSQVFMRDHVRPKPFIQALLPAFGSIGKSAAELWKVADSTIKEFKKFHTEAQIDEGEQLLRYINQFETGPGHVYEMDAISLLIADLISRSGDQGKKSVLLIDDLDRLDPDHIFRLFNVFSGHFDKVSGDNKFGFNKTIFVCDIGNIYEIYKHRYGKNVDFKGYVDKFYSLVPYDFDSKTYIKKEIFSFLQKLRIDGNKSDPIIRKLLLRGEKGDIIYDCFEHVCLMFVEASFINLRSLVQASVRTNSTRLLESNSEPSDIRDYPILWIFHVLADLVGSWDLLNDKFEALPRRFDATYVPRATDLHTPPMDGIEKALTEFCLPFLDEETDILPVVTDGVDHTLKVAELGCIFHYDSVDGKLFDGKYSFELKKTEDLSDKKKKINIYQLLSTTYEKCKNKGYCSK
ncbi:hypothetical protein G5B00_10715 [Parapedobacter sp. SGR-10]|uniref:P-loop NTPase fold protein n=1 Tax=Parapedobacter sp. SGR-10 TaxID=2710879 RepID=UPI0013D6626D|nr:P-loop NTPase fold protein [Parapedobacter sp. SGR-10]NGF56987.1 hypothetical protein [Parapedobacter sp. SGR-10]